VKHPIEIQQAWGNAITINNALRGMKTERLQSELRRDAIDTWFEECEIVLKYAQERFPKFTWPQRD